MRKIIAIVFIGLTLALPSKLVAQDWEYGIMAGFSNYFGDLNSNTSFEYIGPAAGFFTRYNINGRLAWKSGFYYGKVTFSDEGSPDPFQRARNLSFSSNIMEISTQIEINFFQYNKRREDQRFTPYLLAGFGGFFFNPKAELNGEMYALQPVGTEGQNVDGKRYLRVSIAIPVGGGFKYNFHPAWTVGLELGVRKTFTDHLDDVGGNYPVSVVAFNLDQATAGALSDRSGEVGEPIGRVGKQRGLSPKNDDYLFAGITLSYTVLKTRCPKPGKVF